MGEARGDDAARGDGVIPADARVRKRSIAIGRHRTSVSLEAGFWDELATIAARRGQSLAALVAEVDRARITGRDLASAPNLSGALRLFVLGDLRERLEARG